MTTVRDGLLSPHCTDAPFLVSGTVHGRAVTVAVGGPAEVLDQIVRWCREDPAAQGHWRLKGDYSGPVTTAARIRQGVVREARRVAHLFRLRPGVRQGLTLTAGCGETISITDAEWLNVGAGMPCEHCLSTMYNIA